MNNSLPNELLDTISDAIDSLRQRLFAVDLNQGSKKDAYKSIDFLVECLLLLEQHADKSSMREFDSLEYYFLKNVLEKNTPLFYQEQNILGRLRVVRERSPLTIPEQNRISVQVAAQILWRLDGDLYPTIRALAKALRSKSHPLHPLLDLGRFHDVKTFANWVSPMFPVPPEERKKHWGRDGVHLKTLMPIPGIISESGINFAKLRFAAQQISRILQNRGWLLSQVLSSEFIRSLEELLPEALRIYVREWATEQSD